MPSRRERLLGQAVIEFVGGEDGRNLGGNSKSLIVFFGKDKRGTGVIHMYSSFQTDFSENNSSFGALHKPLCHDAMTRTATPSNPIRPSTWRRRPLARPAQYEKLKWAIKWAKDGEMT